MSTDMREVELREAIDLVEGLTAALRTRSAISCAKGILMERYGIDADAAIDLLHEVAQRSGRDARLVAERIIAGEPLEAPRAPRPRSAG